MTERPVLEGVEFGSVVNEAKRRMEKVYQSASEAQAAVNILVADERLNGPALGDIRAKLEAIRNAVDMVLSQS